MTRTPSKRLAFSAVATVIAAIAIAVLANLVSTSFYGRADLSAHRQNSLSSASIGAAQALDGLEIRLYISPTLPELLNNPATGQTVVLRGVEQAFRDQISAYTDAAPGQIRIVEMAEGRAGGDLNAAAEAAQIRLFSGDAARAKDGVMAFDRFMLGATFHYKNAMEVLPLALEPGLYEFEITKALLRLDEKVRAARAMVTVLTAGDELLAAGTPCLDLLKILATPPRAPQPKPLALGPGDAAPAPDIGDHGQELREQCAILPEAAVAARAFESDHEPWTMMVETAEGAAKDWRALAAVLKADGPDTAIQGLGLATQLRATLDGLNAAHRNLQNSPGRKTIGFLCVGNAFCPFPEPAPLVPKELRGLLTQKNPFAAQILPQLLKMTARMDGALGNIERGLFRQRGFEIERLDGTGAIPETVGALVLFGPTAALGDATRYQIDQFVMAGGTLVVFANAWDLRFMTLSRIGTMDESALSPNEDAATPLLSPWGLAITGDLVLEPESHDFISVLSLIQQGTKTWKSQRRLDYPAMPIISDFDRSAPVVRGLTAVTLPFATTLTLTDVPGVRATVLMRTSAEARLTRDTALPLEPSEQVAYAAGAPSSGPAIVAASLEGTLPSGFAKDSIPTPPEGVSWPPHRASGSGRVLVLGSNLGLEPLSRASILEGFSLKDLNEPDVALLDTVRQYGANLQNWELRLSQVEHTLHDNLGLLFNILDWAGQNEGLAEIRAKSLSRRPLAPLDESARNRVKLIGLLAGPALVFMAAVLAWAWRRRRLRGIERMMARGRS